MAPAIPLKHTKRNWVETKTESRKTNNVGSQKIFKKTM